MIDIHLNVEDWLILIMLISVFGGVFIFGWNKAGADSDGWK